MNKNTDIYVDFMHFEPYYNNIEITKIKNGDAYLEGSKIKVGATFTEENAPEEIEYFINNVPVAKGVAPYYEAELTGMPENPNEAKWWLTKRRPDIYADRQYNETKVDANVKSDVTVNLLDKVKQKREELNDSNG